MDVDDPSIIHQYGDKAHQIVGQKNSLKKLHDLVHEFEISNDLPPSPSKEEKSLPYQTNGYTVITDDDNTNNNDRYSLENVKLISEFEMDADMDSEDSWLYESPKKMQTPGQNMSPDKWLKSDVSTPEIMRVRGSLSAKLDVIAIESRKGRNNSSSRRESQEHRRISRHSRRGSGASVNSLDWDYNEDDDESYSESTGYSSQYGSNPELMHRPKETSQLVGLSKTAKGKPAVPDKPFSLDWSDDEEDLEPMQIDFNNISPHGSGRRVIQVAPNPTIVRRGASDLSEPRRANYEVDELTVKPTGMVKPRSRVANAPNDDTDYYPESPASDDYDANAPVVPRGAKNDTPIPRGSVGIAKPVQRRTPESNNGLQLKAQANASNLVKPRSSQNIAKSRSTSDLPVKEDESLKVNPQQIGDASVARRRGPAPTPTAEPGLPQPSKSKDPAMARVRGSIPQVRRSTGSIPLKSESGVAKPRRSVSPSGIARPRGQATTQSYQADY